MAVPLPGQRSLPPLRLALVAGALAGCLAQAARGALAAGLFDSQPLDSRRFAVLAWPVGPAAWNLLVLEQIQPQPLCWETRPDGLIDPALNRFDFTGICSRYLDSNGYSLRIGGEDLEGRYRLRLEQRGNTVALLAMSPSETGLLLVGRGVLPRRDRDGFVAIQLEPGWGLQRRMYGQQSLSHVYFANAASLPQLMGNGNSIAAQPTMHQAQPVQPLSRSLPPFGGGLGETPEEVQQRLEQYRQRDAEAAREKARQEAEAALKREQIRQWQERRRLEEYARRWKRYGDWELDVLSWRQQKYGTWVATYKVLETERRTDSEPLPTPVALPLLPAPLSVLIASQPVRLDPAPMRPVSPPRRHDQLLDDLVRQGVVLPPSERNQIRGGGSGVEPVDVGRFQQLCSSGALSPQECRGGVAIRSRLRPPFPTYPSATAQITPAVVSPASNATPVPQVSLLGVNCTSLMVNRKPAGQVWGKWMRPAEGSYDEQLVVDRCAITKDNQYRRLH